MYLIKTPQFVRNIFPHFMWRVPGDDAVLYLTFDDGPIPGVTPWVLDTLAEWDARATFFCVGDNVAKHPELYRQVLEAGHRVGNHTHNHLNGWKTEQDEYMFNVSRCAKLVDSDLFRPPYGRLRPQQAKLLQRSYQVVMWDVLSGDFDQSITPEQCLQNVLRHAEPGSIVVMHDSLKAEQNLRYALPEILEHFSEKGYRFEAIPDQEMLRLRQAAKTDNVLA